LASFTAHVKKNNKKKKALTVSRDKQRMDKYYYGRMKKMYAEQLSQQTKQ